MSLNCSKMQDLFDANNLDPIIAKLKRFNNKAKVKTKGGWDPNGFYQVIADKEILAYNPKTPGQCMPWLLYVAATGSTKDPELKLLKAFIDAGADLNVEWNGETAFSACIFTAKSLPGAKMLVESGAVPTMKNLDKFLSKEYRVFFDFETIKFLTEQKHKLKEGGLDEETRKSYYLLPEEEDPLIEVLANADITAAEATAVMKDGVSSLKVVQHWLGVVNRLAENDENIVFFRKSETMTIMSEIMKRYGALDIHSIASDVLSALITIANNNTEEEKKIMGESCIPPIFLMMEHSTWVKHSGYSDEKKDNILEQCLTALVNITELEDNKKLMDVEKKPSEGSGYKYDLDDSWFEQSYSVINPRFNEMLQILKKGRN